MRIYLPHWVKCRGLPLAAMSVHSKRMLNFRLGSAVADMASFSKTSNFSSLLKKPFPGQFVTISFIDVSCNCAYRDPVEMSRPQSCDVTVELWHRINCEFLIEISLVKISCFPVFRIFQQNQYKHDMNPKTLDDWVGSASAI
jgi:hypothetical protein